MFALASNAAAASGSKLPANTNCPLSLAILYCKS